MEPEEQMQIYQRIVFQQCDFDEELRRLSGGQKQKLKEAIAQKIAYQSVYRPSIPPDQTPQSQNFYRPPNFFATICCFLYPQENKESFDISSKLFAKKFCHTFLIWKDNFLSLRQNQEVEGEEEIQTHPDLYGPLWLSITQIILLGLTSNLNDYFQAGGTDFTFDTNYLVQALGFSIIFELAQTLIYPAAVGCIGGQISNIQSANLVGYSLILYFLPTLFCVVPSQTWHIIMLIIAAVLRLIFLGRNFSSRLDSKKIMIYIVILAIQGLHFHLVNSTFYSKVAGSAIQAGMDKVFHARVYSE